MTSDTEVVQSLCRVERRPGTEPRDEESTMASLASLQIKMIAALIEATDSDDQKDSERAVKLIAAILEAGEKKPA